MSCYSSIHQSVLHIFYSFSSMFDLIIKTAPQGGCLTLIVCDCFALLRCGTFAHCSCMVSATVDGGESKPSSWQDLTLRLFRMTNIHSVQSYTSATIVMLATTVCT